MKLPCRQPVVVLLLLLVGSLLAQEALDEVELRRRVEVLERTGNYQAALADYQQLRQLAPNDPGLVHGLTRSLEALSDFQAVVDLLTSWLARHPGDFPAYLRLGVAHAELGDRPQAVSTWRRALQHAAPAAELYLHLNDLCQTAGLNTEAVQFLLDGRQALGQPGLYSWELARLYLRQPDYPRAIEEYLVSLYQHPQRYSLVEKQLLELMADEYAASAILQTLQAVLSRPRDRIGDPLQPAMLTASCLLELGDPHSGLQVLASLADHPQIADLLFQYGRRAEEQGYGDAAIHAYSLLAVRYPGSSHFLQALVRQAALSAHRGDHARAVALYQELVDHFPGKPEAGEALFQLGRLQWDELGDTVGACATFRLLLQPPHQGAWSARALESLAECALRRGDLQQADSLLARRPAQDPQTLYAIRFRRAELRYFQHDLTGARQLLETLLAEDAGHQLANDALDLLLRCEKLANEATVSQSFVQAQLLERQHRYSEANRQWQGLLAVAPTALRELSLLTLAQSLAQRGEMREAHEIYTELAAQYPSGRYALDARVGIARWHEQQGELEAALKAFEAALLSAPQDPRAPELRLRIERLRRQM